ncbi:RAD55 family ATPase [Halorubrum vacuolatum]|uniref:DNA repair protein RadA/Sms n=1 Tax=Halorubrum vacuolatum TaxID=63740 RepID=A0A238UP32_HALVU|nr:ATPase domain-containing protein [Halorubrum vacuolatum]SNR23845.1 DNA repair protein RadA/Sms [Halorubrum vacuolatum]
MDRLATGIPVLDRVLDGGLPPGSVVVLKADAASQSELFINTFCGVRETQYVTTVRSTTTVERGIERSDAVDTESVTVHAAHDEEAIERTAAVVSELDTESTLIVDSVEPLERTDAETYRRFIDDLMTRVIDAEAIAILHAVRSEHDPENRVLTEQMADLVFDLRSRVTGTDVEHRLIVPKFRGGVIPEKPLKLKLGESVTVDTSRDIA